jgi:glycosyltransferase involved in cell wall biosynthesis
LTLVTHKYNIIDIKKNITKLKKILYIPTRYFPSISGAEFYIQRIAEILNKNYNYLTEIYTSNAIDFKALRSTNGKTIKPHEKYYDNVNNIRVYRFPVREDYILSDKLKFLESIPEFNSLNLSKQCAKLIIQNGPYLPDLINFFSTSNKINFDLIHSSFFPYFNLIISLIIGKIINKPTVCTPFFHFSNPRYLNPMLIEVLNKFNIIIACTQLEKEFLIKQYDVNKDKIEVIPMGVDINIFNIQKNVKQYNYSFKEQYFKEREKNYKMILFCGYKNYEKGALSILKAIPYILNKVKKAYFVFIGPSTMAYNRESSKIQKNENVRIINLTPDNLNGYFDKKKISAFREADIYLMPSRSDAFGIAFLEAWASGKPVIGANIGATSEVIKNNIDGYLVEFNNPIDIAEKVVKLLKHKRLRKKFGSNGKLKVSQNFAWDNIVNKTHTLYEKLINPC